MIKTKKYLFTATISGFLACMSSLLHASENTITSAYLCTDSNDILLSATLENSITTARQILQNSTLLVTNGNQLFFNRYYENKEVYYSPVFEKTDEFELLTFENEVVAISQKINGEIRNQRYLCAQHAAFSELIGLLEDRWSDYLLTMANKKKD